jgi:hypothetical protein
VIRCLTSIARPLAIVERRLICYSAGLLGGNDDPAL